MEPDITTLTLAPPRPAGSKVWVAYRNERDGLRLVRDKITDWDDLSEASLSRGEGDTIGVRILWSAHLKRLYNGPYAKPSQLFSTKEELLAHLAKTNRGPSFWESEDCDEPNEVAPPIPVGTKVWTWFANGFNDEDLCGRVSEAPIGSWLAEAPKRLTRDYLKKVSWKAWVGGSGGYYHRPEHLFPTKEALLEYLDRTAIDLTK